MKIDLPAEVNAEIQTNLKAQNAAEIQAEIDSQRQVNFKSSMTVAAGFEPVRYGEALQLERKTGVPAKVAYDNWDKVQQVKQEDKLTGLFTTTPRTADALSNPQHAIIAKGDEENLQYMERAVERATFDQQGFFDRQIAGPFQKWWNRDTIGEAPGRLRQLDRITTDFDRVDAGDDFSSPWANEYRAADEAGRKVMRDNLQLEQNLSIEKTRGAQFEIGQMPVDPGDVAFDKAQGVAGVASTIANDPLWAARKAGESLPDMAQGLALGLINPIFGSVSEGTTAANYKLIEVLQEKGIDPSDPIQLMKALRDDDLMNEANTRAARYGAGIGAVSLLSFGLLGKVMAPTAIGGKALTTGQRELISAGVQMPVQGALEAAGEAAGQLAERGQASDLDSKEIALEGFLGTLMAVPEAGGFAGKRFMQHMAQARRTERAATLQTDLVGKSLESSTRKNDPATFDSIVGAQLAGKPNEWLEIPAAKLQELNQSGQVNVPELLEQINVDPNHYAAQVELGGTVRMKNSSYLAYLAEYDEQLSSSVRFSTNDMSLEEVQAIDKQMLADMEQVAQNFGKTDQVAAAYSDVMGQLLGAGYERSAADTTARQYAAVMTRLAEQTGQTVEDVMAANPLNIGRDLPPAVRRIKGDEISLMLGRLRAGDIPRPADMFGKSLTEYLTAAGGLDDTGGELAAFDADVGKIGRNRLARTGGQSLDDAAMAAWERGYFPGMAREDVTPNMLIDALREEAAGTPRYSVEQENATLRDQAQSLEALQEYLDREGIDLATVTDDEIRQRLGVQPGNQRLDQFAGPRALTANQRALMDAQRRLESGDDSEKVRQETGWFKGADGKMRFEIADGDAKLTPTFQQMKYSQFGGDSITSVSYRDGAGIWSVQIVTDGMSTPADIIKLTTTDIDSLAPLIGENLIEKMKSGAGEEDITSDEADSKYLATDGEIFRSPTGKWSTLGEVLDHPRLFQAYPALANLKVVYAPELTDGAHGAMAVNARTGEPIMVLADGTENEVRKTVLHETQHAVQAIEGFARGGSVNRLRNEPAYRESVTQENKQFQMQQWAEKYPEAAALRAEIIALHDQLEKQYGDPFSDEAIASDSFGKWEDAIERSFEVEGYDAAPQENLDEVAPLEFYHRLAGEIEARTVEARSHMSDIIAKLIPPSRSQDIEDAKAIVHWEGEDLPSPEIDLAAAKVQTLNQSDYMMDHRPPGPEDGAPLDDLTGGGNIYPDDVYSSNGQRYYGTGHSSDAEAFRKAKSYRGEPDAPITIYRAVPTDAGDEINPGDWVAITKSYAEDHGEGLGDYKIITKQVKARDIFTNGDSIQEWGYWPSDATTLNQSANASPDLDRALAMSEDEYIATINPSGETNDEDGSARLVRGDLTDPQNATVLVTLDNGVTIERDEDGSFYAREGGDTIGEIVNYGDEVNVNVLPEARGKGVAVNLAAEFMRENPFFDAGSLTPGGEAVVRAAWRKLKAEQSTTLNQSAQTETEAFKRWFGDSKVVDANGKPLVVYHGTPSDFDSFSGKFLGKVTRATSSKSGFFFASTPRTAQSYADHGATVAPVQELVEQAEKAGDRGNWDKYDELMLEAEQLEASMVGDGMARGQNIMPVYLSIQNPLEIDAAGENPEGIGGIDPLIKRAQREGRDGVIIRNFDDAAGLYNELADHFIAFKPEQIKSAIGNRGTFDPADPNILNQGDEETPRGSITFGPRRDGVRRFDIKLTAKSDLSTVLHEMGHYYLEVIGDLVQGGKANEALAADYSVIRDWLGADPVGTSTKTKPVASGMVRLYHGGTEGSEKTGGQRYLTPDKAYAQGYADKATNGRLYYVDVPADSPLLVKAFDDSGTGQTAPFVAFNAPDELSAQLLQFNENDMAAIGATPLTVDQHEQFARGFEKYLATGKAPSIELQDAFARFKRWLVGVYKDLARLNVEISPEVRGVFDRLLASEQAITEAEQALALTEQYEARITELMSEDEKANYLRASRQARDDATSEIEQEILKAEQQKEQRWYKEQRRKVEAEVRSELEASQAYQARKYLFGNTPHPDIGRALRLDTAAVTELFGTKSKEARFLGRARARENGVHPEIAASILGYPNPVEMLTDMRAVPSLAEAVKLETERRMAERYPDPRKDGTLADKAMAAVGEREAEVQAIQLRTLARQAGRAPSQHKIIKEAARRHIASLKLRDVIPHAFRRASEKAARAVEDALIKGDMPKAYEEKEKQLMNLHLFREAVKAQDLSIQKRAQAKAYTKAGAKRKRLQDASVENYELAYPDGRIEYAATKTAAKQAEADGATVTPLFNFLEQVDAILTRYEFSIPRRAIRQQREALVEFLASMSGEHIVVNPPEWILLDRSQRTNWSELTIDELVDAVDMIKQIDQMAKNKLQVLKAGRWEEFEPIRDAIVNSIELNASSARSSQFNKSFADDIRRWGREWLGLLPVDQIARELDGQDDLGPVQENITTPVQVAARKAVIREKAEHQALAELIKQFYSDDQIKGMAEKRIAVAEINDSLTKMQMIMLMANLGNEGNRKALLSEQRGIWSAETIQSVMSRMDSNDADFVEALWSWVDKFWPEVSENEARRTGVTPAKVENDPYPVKLADGKVRVLKGGYFPLKYDGDMSIKTSQDDVANAFKNMTAGRTAKAYTPEGHRIERVGSGGRPVKLDLSVVLGHVNEVVRDIVMTDPVNQSWRYLHDSEIQGAFERSNLKEIFTALEIWLQDTAEGEKVDSGYMTASARWLRTGFTANVMLFNLANSALNLAGTHPLVVLGKRWALNGYRNAMKPANWQQMYELSEYMREARVDSYSKDLQLVQDHMRNKGGWRDVMTTAGFYLHNKTQMFMDAVTWMGAYEKGMSMDLVGQDLITYADQRVVEASGSGVFADRSAIERGTITRQTRQNELVRGLTTLAGYMIRKMAIARRRTAETDFKDVAQAVNWAVDMALLFTVEGLMFALVKGNVPDEEDEDQAAGWAKSAAWETFASVGSGLPPFGRPIVAGLQGFGGGSTSMDIFAEQFGNAITQAKQGDADVTAAKALIAMVGTATKTPGIATNRVIDWLDRAKDGETPPWYELLTGNRDK